MSRNTATKRTVAVQLWLKGLAAFLFSCLSAVAQTTFTTYLAPYGSNPLPTYQGATVVVPMRAYNPNGAGKVNTMEGFLENASTGAIDFEIVAQTNGAGGFTLRATDLVHGVVPDPNLLMSSNGITQTISPAISTGTLQITAYRFALVNNEMQLDVTLTRTGTFNEQIVIQGYDGTKYSSPAAAVDGYWNSAPAPTTFTTYLGTYGSSPLPTYQGTTVVVPMRAYDPNGASKINTVEGFLENASTGAIDFEIVAQTNGTGGYTLRATDLVHGVVPDPNLLMSYSGTTQTISPAISTGTLQITAYRFALVNNEMQLDVTLTRAGAFNEQIVVQAYDGTKYSSPAAAVDGYWNSTSSSTPLQITQWGYDNNHTTANLKETILNTSNVNSKSFGKVGSYSVNGPVFAQPLYMQGVNVPGVGVKNVLYLATMNATLYAFDADNPGTAPLWSRDYTNGGAILPAAGDPGNIGQYEGIWGTPVIDPTLGEIFFIVGTQVGTQVPNYLNDVFTLHAVSIASGTEIGTSQAITGSYSIGSYSVNFASPLRRGNRPGLALSNGQIFVAFGADNSYDEGPYTGWVFTFNEKTLAQVGIFATSTTGNQDGIWASGAAPSIDPNGRVYFTTGNGPNNDPTVATGAYDGVNNFNESVLQFTPPAGAGQMKPTDWYTPSNVAYLDGLDLDVGCSATAIIPGTNILLAGGKTSEVYAIKMSNMGRFQAESSPNPPWATTDPQLSQTFHVGSGTVVNYSDTDRIVQFPMWPNSPTGSTLVYVWPSLDNLYVYQAGSNGILSPYPDSKTHGPIQGPGFQGVQLALSANGSTAGTGILWASINTSGGVSGSGQGGTLYAFDAQNVASSALWSTSTPYAAGKWVLPVVANGRVYFAGNTVITPQITYEVDVYGLLP